MNRLTLLNLYDNESHLGDYDEPDGPKGWYEGFSTSKHEILENDNFKQFKWEYEGVLETLISFKQDLDEYEISMVNYPNITHVESNLNLKIKDIRPIVLEEVIAESLILEGDLNGIKCINVRDLYCVGNMNSLVELHCDSIDYDCEAVFKYLKYLYLKTINTNEFYKLNVEELVTISINDVLGTLYIYCKEKLEHVFIGSGETIVEIYKNSVIKTIVIDIGEVCYETRADKYPKSLDVVIVKGFCVDEDERVPEFKGVGFVSIFVRTY